MEVKPIGGLASSLSQTKKNAGQAKCFKSWYCQACRWVYVEVEPQGLQWGSTQTEQSLALKEAYNIKTTVRK